MERGGKGTTVLRRQIMKEEVRLCALRDSESSQYSSALMEAKLRIVIHILTKSCVCIGEETRSA